MWLAEENVRNSVGSICVSHNIVSHLCLELTESTCLRQSYWLPNALNISSVAEDCWCFFSILSLSVQHGLCWCADTLLRPFWIMLPMLLLLQQSNWHCFTLALARWGFLSHHGCTAAKTEFEITFICYNNYSQPLKAMVVNVHRVREGQCWITNKFKTVYLLYTLSPLFPLQARAKKPRSSVSTRSWPISAPSSRGTKLWMATARRSMSASCSSSFCWVMTSISGTWRQSTCLAPTSTLKSRL